MSNLYKFLTNHKCKGNEKENLNLTQTAIVLLFILQQLNELHNKVCEKLHLDISSFGFTKNKKKILGSNHVILNKSSVWFKCFEINFIFLAHLLFCLHQELEAIEL